MTRRKLPPKKAILDAIPNTGGVVSRIAEKLGYAWHTTKAAIDADPEILAAYVDECERVNDAAESNIIKAIAAGDVDNSKWWLRTRRRAKFGDALALQNPDGSALSWAQFVGKEKNDSGNTDPGTDSK